MGEIQAAINGFLHGPVHIMIGGLWGLDDALWGPVTADDSTYHISPVTMFLFAKFMWRQGAIRCPKACAADAPQEECLCACPAEIRAQYGDGSAGAVLNGTGAASQTDFLSENAYATQSAAGLTHDVTLDALCRVGFPGEMFTSAAPQDPTFWPLHGNAERYLQFLRLLSNRGVVAIDDAWGYNHVRAASDTHVVCDWDAVDAADPFAMPACAEATCPGHGQVDLLPFTDLLSPAGGDVRSWSNEEFYAATLPGRDSPMPYVYDSLAFWPGCPNNLVLDLDAAQTTAAPSRGPPPPPKPAKTRHRPS